MAASMLSACAVAAQPSELSQTPGSAPFRMVLTECRVTLGDNPEYTMSADFNNPQWLPVQSKDERNGEGILWYVCFFDLEDRPVQLVLFLQGVRHGDETYLNGSMVGRSGTMDNFPYYAESRVYPLPNELLKSGRNLLSVRLRIAGGFARMGQPELRNSEELEPLLRSASTVRYRELVLASVFFFVACYFYFLWGNFRYARDNLYFALFSTLLSAYLIARTGVPFFYGGGALQLRLEYITVFIASPVFLRFLFAFLGRPFPIIVYIYDAFIVMCVAVVLGSADPDLWRTTLRAVQFSMLAAIAGGLTVLFLAVRNGNVEARYIVWAFVIFCATVVNDVLASMNWIRTPLLFLYGFVIFLLGIALILANRYVMLFGRQEEQAAALRDLDRRKTEFLSNVSHELKTPLAEIMLYAESIADGTLETEEDISDAHEEIEKSAARLQHIVSDTVLLNMLETDRYSPQISSCRLDRCLEDAADALAALAQKHNITVDVVNPAGAAVQSDPALLERILQHLIENGILYNKAGGRVTIVVRPQADEVEISISDEGSGLPAEVKTRLFEKFVRGDASNTYAIGGTGTGLALASIAARKMAGSLRMLRTGPEGTEFSLRLKAAEYA